VDKHEDLDDAVREMRNAKGAFLLEVRVQKEENVFPMVPAGQPLENIRLE
jgi:acetolactate synthase-1/2/3 large subunit